MNAQTSLPAPRDRYIPNVLAHVPGCEGEELKLRCSLLLSRDQASAWLRHASEEAAPVLEQIDRLCGAYAFASMRPASLKALRYQIVMLAACASGLDGFAEGMNARG